MPEHPEKTEFARWRDQIVWALASGAAISLTTWTVWVTHAVYSRPTMEEVALIISEQGPYVRDRRSLQDAMKHAENTNKQLLAVINNNTEAITGLRVQMAEISTLIHQQQKSQK